MEDFPLPKLHPLVRIYPSNNKFDGEPQWTLYQPVTNKFFKIGWKEFECLARFHKCDNIQSLCSVIKDETGQIIDADDVKSVIMFLQGNDLLKTVAQSFDRSEKQSLVKKALHGYLYFTIPLLKPQPYLDKFYPFVRYFFTKSMAVIVLMAMIIGVIMTVPRLDEFLNTFSHIFSVEGAIVTFISFALIKIIHEFSHAFMATKYGVKVPHMGLAFVVMYPILYTEGTNAWKLKDKHARAHIGMAGIYAEVAIAAIALIFWNFTSAGLLQMMLFSIVTISLLGSLLVNLNPLMRFDGYYVLSDLSGIDNLHATAIDYARNGLRRFLFGLCDLLLYGYPSQTVRWLTFFGFFVLIYRFFLFFGIAILVYHVFIKPLGLLAMMLELFWFIGLPILGEFKIWWERREDIMANMYGKIAIILVLIGFVLCFVPMSSSVYAPAALHASKYRAYYPVQDSEILNVFVKNGQEVSMGDVLATLKSDILEKDLNIAKAELDNLQSLKRREQTDIELYRSRRGLIDQQIVAAQSHYQNLKDQYVDLKIIAEFDGVISDLSSNFQEGQTVNRDHLLFLLLEGDNKEISAYVMEEDIHRIHIGNEVKLRLGYELFSSIIGRIVAIEAVNLSELDFPILASVNNGSVLTHLEKGVLRPVHTLYRVKIMPANMSQITHNRVVSGIVKIQGEKISMIEKIVMYFSQLYHENSNFN